jgi:hypothetical protein
MIGYIEQKRKILTKIFNIKIYFNWLRNNYLIGKFFDGINNGEWLIGKKGIFEIGLSDDFIVEI